MQIFLNRILNFHNLQLVLLVSLALSLNVFCNVPSFLTSVINQLTIFFPISLLYCLELDVLRCLETRLCKQLVICRLGVHHEFVTRSQITKIFAEHVWRESDRDIQREERLCADPQLSAHLHRQFQVTRVLLPVFLENTQFGWRRD